MAYKDKWAIKWRMQFRSLNGTGCLINIYTDDDTFAPTADTTKTGADVPFPVESGVKELVAAKDPFFFEERNSQSLSDYVRYRTGYIRFIEEDGNTTDDLRPQTGTSRFVTVYYGSSLVFTGYLQCQNFSNNFVSFPRKAEIPVISPLGLLDTIKFPALQQMGKITIDSIFKIVLDLINPEGESQGVGTGYQRIIFPAMVQLDILPTPAYNLNAPFEGLMNYRAVCPFNEENICYDVYPDEEIYTPSTLYDFIEGFCKIFSYMLHDTPGVLLFTRSYYPNSYVKKHRYITVESLGTDTIISGEYATTVANKDVSGYFDFIDNGRENTIMPSNEVRFSITTLKSQTNYPVPFNLNKYYSKTDYNTILYTNLDPRISKSYWRYNHPGQNYISQGYGMFIGSCIFNQDMPQLYMRFGTRPADPAIYESIDFVWYGLPYANMEEYSGLVAFLKFNMKVRFGDTPETANNDLPDMGTPHEGYGMWIGATVYVDGVQRVTYDLYVPTNGEISLSVGNGSEKKYSVIRVSLVIRWTSNLENKFIRFSTLSLDMPNSDIRRNAYTGLFNNFIERSDNRSSKITNINSTYSCFDGSDLTTQLIYPFWSTSEKTVARLYREKPSFPYLFNPISFLRIRAKEKGNVSFVRHYLDLWNMNDLMLKNGTSYTWRLLTYSFYPAEDMYNTQWANIIV